MALQAAFFHRLRYPRGSGIRVRLTKSFAHSHLSLHNRVSRNRRSLETHQLRHLHRERHAFLKEVADGNVASVIPLEYAESGNLQEAVDKTTEFLRDSMDALEGAAKKGRRNGKLWNEEAAR